MHPLGDCRAGSSPAADPGVFLPAARPGSAPGLPMASNNTASIAQARKLVEQLKMEANIDRIKVGILGSRLWECWEVVAAAQSSWWELGCGARWCLWRMLFQVILMALAELWEMLTHGIIESRNGLGWKRP